MDFCFCRGINLVMGIFWLVMMIFFFGLILYKSLGRLIFIWLILMVFIVDFSFFGLMLILIIVCFYWELFDGIRI